MTASVTPMLLATALSETVATRIGKLAAIDTTVGETADVATALATYTNLFGHIEYRQVAGMLQTDFSLIRPGALHRANGGILVLRAESLAANGYSWAQLKGALRPAIAIGGQ